MLKKLLTLSAILILAAGAAQAGNDVEFRGYPNGRVGDYEENYDLKTPSACKAYGKKWLKEQTGEEAFYSCGTGCDKRPDGSNFCKSICEYRQKGPAVCGSNETVARKTFVRVPPVSKPD